MRAWSRMDGPPSTVARGPSWPSTHDILVKSLVEIWMPCRSMLSTIASIWSEQRGWPSGESYSATCCTMRAEKAATLMLVSLPERESVRIQIAPGHIS